jgi:hypothetical protein
MNGTVVTPARPTRQGDTMTAPVRGQRRRGVPSLVLPGDP